MVRAHFHPLYATLLFSLLFLSGCSGTVKNMRAITPGDGITTPDTGMSRIILMRPSGIGFAIQSSVFEVSPNNNASSLVGIVAAKKCISHQVKPGKHLFMVIGESADFMSAEVEANKTYYALVTPRMGVWKARFSLEPVHADQFNTPEFKDWVGSCEWVEKSEDSLRWEREHLADIYEKQHQYYPKWMEKSATERPHLSPTDGR